MFSFLWNNVKEHQQGDVIRRAIESGDVSEFVMVLERQFKDAWQQHRGPTLEGISLTGGRTVLHQAALMNGSALDIVKFICKTCPFLMGRLTAEGDTVWHLAVKDCSCAVFNILYDLREDIIKTSKLRDDGIVSVEGVVGEWEDLSLRAVNHSTGNTALHEALLSGNRAAAGKLFVADMDLCYQLNKENKSPLYMAAELEEDVLFKNMFTWAISFPEGFEKIGLGKSIVRVAISKKRKDFLSLMWDLEPLLFQLGDDEDKLDDAFPNNSDFSNELQARSIGPPVDYAGLLALKNNFGMPPPPDAHSTGFSKLKLLNSEAVSRGKEIMQDLLLLFPRRPIRNQSDQEMIDLLVLVSIAVLVFSFILTRISSLYIQPLYGINMFLMYITCPGTLVTLLAKISGYKMGMTAKTQTWYLTVVTSVEGVVITILINLLIKKLMYVAAATFVVVILPTFFLHVCCGGARNTSTTNPSRKRVDKSRHYSRDRYGIKSASKYEQERARLVQYSRRKQPPIRV